MQRKLVPLSILLALALAACDREERDFAVEPPAASAINSIQMTALQPGVPAPGQVKTSDAYESNAYAMSQGQQLFTAFNCVGCHAHGGGGIGPPLMDDKWIYGSDPANIFATIVQGRPNGMPSFRNKIPNNQVWQIVAYVRSLSGQARTDAAPGRADEMQVTHPPQAVDQETPKESSLPPSAQMPQ